MSNQSEFLKNLEKEFIQDTFVDTFQNKKEKIYKPLDIYKESFQYFHSPEKSKPQDIRRPKSSWLLVSWVVNHSSLPPNYKIIAARIAGYYNVGSRLIFPSMDTLVRDTGCNKATVAKAIKFMQSSGEWHIHSTTQPGSSRTQNLYIPYSPLYGDKSLGTQWISSRRNEAYLKFMENKKETKEKRSQGYKKRIKESGVDSLNKIPKNEPIDPFGIAEVNEND